VDGISFDSILESEAS